MQQIQACAASNNIAVVLGYSENYNNSLYISQSIIAPDGEVKIHRRKLKATHMERTIFGEATGDSLKNVVDIESVGRVGALACWEHTQPLLKYHTYLQNEAVHVSAWPPVFEHTGGPDLWSMSREGTLRKCPKHSPKANSREQGAVIFPKPTRSNRRASCFTAHR
jgi:nitrilase